MPRRGIGLERLVLAAFLSRVLQTLGLAPAFSRLGSAARKPASHAERSDGVVDAMVSVREKGKLWVSTM